MSHITDPESFLDSNVKELQEEVSLRSEKLAAKIPKLEANVSKVNALAAKLRNTHTALVTESNLTLNFVKAGHRRYIKETKKGL